MFPQASATSAPELLLARLSARRTCSRLGIADAIGLRPEDAVATLLPTAPPRSRHTRAFAQTSDTTYVSPACDGLPGNSPDTRFPASLPNGPVPSTQYGPYSHSHLDTLQSGQAM